MKQLNNLCLLVTLLDYKLSFLVDAMGLQNAIVPPTAAKQWVVTSIDVNVIVLFLFESYRACLLMNKLPMLLYWFWAIKLTRLVHVVKKKCATLLDSTQSQLDRWGGDVFHDQQDSFDGALKDINPLSYAVASKWW